MKIKIIVLMTAIIASSCFAGAESEIKDAFESGNLFKSIELVNKSKLSQGKKNYWLGKNYFGLEDYARSAKYLKIAIDSKISLPSDIYYDYALANYNINELQEAKVYFRKYLVKNPQDSEALYLVGDILRLQGSVKTASRNFNKILNQKNASKNIQQNAAYQLAEIESAQILKVKNRKSFVEKSLIPKYEKAYAINSRSVLATEIDKTIQALARKYGLKIKSKLKTKYSADLSQEFTYDSNVLLIPDDASRAQAQDQDAFVSRTGASGSYDFDYGAMKLTPTFSLMVDKYFDEVDPNIYQNNQYSINPMLKFAYSHKVLGKKAVFLANVSHLGIERDYLAEKEYEFFSRSNSYSIGELVNYFDFGPTIINLRQERSFFYSDFLNAKKDSLSVTQIYNMKNKDKLIALVGYDYKEAEDPLFDVSMLNTTAIYKSETLLEKYGLKNYEFKSGVTFLLTDYKNQSEVRGIEKNINIFTQAMRDFYFNTKIAGRYTFTKNFSDEENFNYTRHQLAVLLTYKF